MYIDRLEIQTLVDFICSCCRYEDDRNLKQNLYRLFQLYLFKEVSICETFNLAEEPFISQIIRMCNLSYYYFEGAKNLFCYKTFFEYIKTKRVLLVLDGKNVKRIFKEKELSSIIDRTFVYIICENNQIFLHACGEKKRLSRRMLFRLFMSNKKILSNPCFVTDEGDKKQLIKGLLTKMEHEQRMSEIYEMKFILPKKLWVSLRENLRGIMEEDESNSKDNRIT